MTQPAINAGIALERDRTRREWTSKLNDLRARYGLLSARERKVLQLVGTGLAQQAGCRRTKGERGNGEGAPSPSDEEVGREVASRLDPNGQRSRSRPARYRALIDDYRRLAIGLQAPDQAVGCERRLTLR